MKVTAKVFKYFLKKEKGDDVTPPRNNEIENDNDEGNVDNVDNNSDVDVDVDVDVEQRRIASELIIFYQTQQIERLRNENNRLVVKSVVQEGRIEELNENFHDQRNTIIDLRDIIDDQQEDIQFQRDTVTSRERIIRNQKRTIKSLKVIKCYKLEIESSKWMTVIRLCSSIFIIVAKPWSVSSEYFWNYMTFLFY